MPDQSSGQPMAKTVLSFDPKDVQENKYLAALSYIGILFLIPLFAAKQSAFAQEHAHQGLVLFIVDVIGSFIFWIPLIGWLLALVIFALHVVAFVKCLMGEFWEVPIFGKWRGKMKMS